MPAGAVSFEAGRFGVADEAAIPVEVADEIAFFRLKQNPTSGKIDRFAEHPVMGVRQNKPRRVDDTDTSGFFFFRLDRSGVDDLLGESVPVEDHAEYADGSAFGVASAADLT